MNIFDHLDGFQADLRSKGLEELEEKYYNLCSKLAGIGFTDEIRKVDLQSYENKLTDLLQESIQLAHKQKAKAIYFEYDLDNNWDSAFFICGDYSPLEDEDDDWASDWYGNVEGPALEKFSEIHNINGFDKNEIAIGTTVYLIARTVLSFARAYNNVPTEDSLAICIAFHDQDLIIRIKE
ncbi:hypothetical protein DZB84_14785 [Bacillus sp. HNG]|uniref:hypothetical protein n=1 Tax=Bacillus sp. HNG TaxID=2293325 RepID=UPI000E2F4EC5|nr:hypothetical protein [Bacillus sp. HNG]RFB14709.1 hypothetical protein DZB84_14785 [Bacillus sp. HNG]